MKIDSAFWAHLESLVAGGNVIVDRPQGTPHPRYPDVIYPLDYGYIAGTGTVDGGGVDMWIGTTGLARVDGVLCTVDLEKADAEVKILFSCTPEEMERACAFHTGASSSCVLIGRE